MANDPSPFLLSSALFRGRQVKFWTFVSMLLIHFSLPTSDQPLTYSKVSLPNQSAELESGESIRLDLQTVQGVDEWQSLRQIGHVQFEPDTSSPEMDA